MGAIVRVPILNPVVVDLPAEHRTKVPHRVPLPIANPVPIHTDKPVPIFDRVDVKQPIAVVKTITEKVDFEVYRPIPDSTTILVPLFQPELVDQEQPMTRPVQDHVDQEVIVNVPQFELMAPGEETPIDVEMGVPMPTMMSGPPMSDLPAMAPEPEFDIYGYQGQQITGSPPLGSPIDFFA